MATLTEEMGAPGSLKAHTATGLAAFRQAIDTLAELRVRDPPERQHRAARADRRLRPDHALELADPADLQQAGLGLRGGLHGRASSRASSRRSAPSCWPRSCTRPACRRACSTWSTATGRRWATRSARTPTSTWCRSPARRGPASWWPQAAAPTVKRVCQELGGKSANIILPDADLRAAASCSVARGFSNTGQSCHSPTRILVHETSRDEMLGHLKEVAAQGARRRSAGSRHDDGAGGQQGPVRADPELHPDRHRRRRRLVCGGPGRPEGLERGYYVRPTIFADVTPDMTIAREEIFGPVLAVMTYADARGSDGDRQRHRLRPRRLRLLVATARRCSNWRAASRPGASSSTARPATRRRRWAATSSPATGARWASSASRSTSR